MVPSISNSKSSAMLIMSFSVNQTGRLTCEMNTTHTTYSWLDLMKTCTDTVYESLTFWFSVFRFRVILMLQHFLFHQFVVVSCPVSTWQSHRTYQAPFKGKALTGLDVFISTYCIKSAVWNHFSLKHSKMCKKNCQQNDVTSCVEETKLACLPASPGPKEPLSPPLSACSLASCTANWANKLTVATVMMSEKNTVCMHSSYYCYFLGVWLHGGQFLQLIDATHVFGNYEATVSRGLA